MIVQEAVRQDPPTPTTTTFYLSRPPVINTISNINSINTNMAIDLIPV